MKYSTEEQVTGDLWLDGRIIYKKIIEVNPTGLEKGTSRTIILNMDPNIELISADTIQIRIAGSGGPTLGQIDRVGIYSGDLQSFIIEIRHVAQFNQLNIGIAITDEADVWDTPFGADIRMAISYTKTNEEPLI